MKRLNFGAIENVRAVATYGLSGLKMNMLSGVTVLTGFISSASSFSDLQVSGSFMFTGEEKEKTRLGQA